MTLLAYLLGLALIAAASSFVVAPLFRPPAAGGETERDTNRERWERRKRQALAGIKEAELDHRMGKLSDGDLAMMRARFEAEALEAMAALDRGGGG
jgi:hypothetical protein